MFVQDVETNDFAHDWDGFGDFGVIGKRRASTNVGECPDCLDEVVAVLSVVDEVNGSIDTPSFDELIPDSRGVPGEITDSPDGLISNAGFIFD